MTELEREADRWYPKGAGVFTPGGAELLQKAFIHGAEYQKEIDDEELSDALFIQRQMLIEKAVQHIMVTPAYAVQPEVYAEGLRKAMEE